MKRRLSARLLAVFLSLAQASLPAWAQDAAPAPAGTGTQALPPIAVPAVQTPTITNAPAQAPLQLTPEQAAKAAERLAPQATEKKPVVPDNTRDRNEFQDFIAQSTGQRLPLFGYDLFAGAPSTFAPVDNVPVTPDYVIGPGDQLLIRAWGQLDVDYRATVDRNGMINIPKVGSVQVAGIRYQDITNVVHTAVSRNFRNFDLLVTMGQLRSVQVFVVGQAKRPGAYTVSSLSTLVNAVFAAGGPSSRGSMRAIQLKRGNQVVTTLDLYDLLVSGDKSKDAQLLPGDVIYFPPVGPQAAIAGSVNTPAIYELKGETTVGQLIALAGGLTATAQTKRASIERIADRQARTADLFALDRAGDARALHDGDLLTVFSISPRFEQVVTLRGHVAAPLRYPFHEGMRIRDLIPEKDALITPDYYLRKNLAVRADTVTTGGLTDSVRRLADEINWDYAVIERQNPQDLSTTLIPFNLGKAILENDPTQNLPLKAGDVVTVFSKTDVQAPAERRPVVVRLEGEVKYAGVYQAQPGETLRQLVVRVGGLTSKAYLFGAEFTRESTRLEQEENLRKTLRELEGDLQRATATQSTSVLSPEDAKALPEQYAAQRRLISQLSRRQAHGAHRPAAPRGRQGRRPARPRARGRRPPVRPGAPERRQRARLRVQQRHLPLPARPDRLRLPRPGRRPAEGSRQRQHLRAARQRRRHERAPVRHHGRLARLRAAHARRRGRRARAVLPQHAHQGPEGLDADLLPVRPRRRGAAGHQELLRHRMADEQRPADSADDEISLLDLLIVLAKHKRLVLGLPIAAAVVSIVVSLLLPNVYTGTTRILPPQQSQPSSALLAQLGSLPGLAASGVAASLKNPNDLYVGMLKSRTVADNLIQRFDLNKLYDEKYQSVTRKRLQDLTTIVSGKDGIITVEVDDKDPKRAAAMANAYIDELFKLTTVLAVTEASQRRLFFERQLELAKANLTKAEIDAQQAMHQGGVVAVEAQGRTAVETAARLRAEISVKEVQISAMRTFAAEGNPDLKRTQEELEAMKREVAKTEGGKGSDAVEAPALDKSGISNLALLRNVKYYQTMVDLLTNQYENAKIDEAKDSTLIQVMDKAIVPDRKSKPRRALIVILWTLMAGLVAVVWAFVREAMEKARGTPEQSQRLRRLRAYLGVRPK